MLSSGRVPAATAVVSPQADVRTPRLRGYSASFLAHLLLMFPLWFFLRRARTILDLGCGEHSLLIPFLSWEQRIEGVDASAAVVQRASPRYARVFVGDVRTWAFPRGVYDVVAACDLIEHLTKSEGGALLARCERSARRRVIVFTPNGYLPQPSPGEPLQEHRSGWSVGDFRKRGYRVYGCYGPRGLRGERGVLRARPRVVFGFLNLLLAPLLFFLPSWSFSLLAVYDTPDRR